MGRAKEVKMRSRDLNSGALNLSPNLLGDLGQEAPALWVHLPHLLPWTLPKGPAGSNNHPSTHPLHLG